MIFIGALIFRVPVAGWWLGLRRGIMRDDVRHISLQDGGAAFQNVHAEDRTHCTSPPGLDRISIAC
jgi:hypothetical protein